MSDRCQTHKARACQKCAEDAEVHPGIRKQWREDFSSEIVRCSWSEEAHLAFLDALEAAEADARRWKQIAKNFSEDCTVTEREAERLAGVVAKVRELARVQAIACQAQHRADHARNWLDVLALLDQADPS